MHGNDGIHRNIPHGCQLQFCAQIVGAVAKHCPPSQPEVAVSVGCLDALAGKLERNLCRRGIGDKVFCLNAAKSHCRGWSFCAIGKANAEEILAWHQSHRLTAVEGQLALVLSERSREQVVGKRIGLAAN